MNVRFKLSSCTFLFEQVNILAEDREKISSIELGGRLLIIHFCEFDSVG